MMAIRFEKLGNYGRTGNSMFQAATTMALAWRNDAGFQFPAWKHQNDFNISGYHFVDRLKKSAFTYEEPHYHYSSIPFKNDMNLNGYFQSEKYFKDFEDKIREAFKTKYKYEYRKNICSIHVRRGDYLTHNGCYVNLGMNYYEKAMMLSGCKNFMVFSDDINWCKTQFIGKEFEFSHEQHPVKDMSKMLSCGSNIIANSSFSWWAAWLNPNKEKTVIAPNSWFGPKLSSTHDTKDLLPGEWTKI